MHVHIGWPQGIYLGLLGLAFVIHSCKQGQIQAVDYDVKKILVRAAIMLPLLYWGGFFG